MVIGEWESIGPTLIDQGIPDLGWIGRVTTIDIHPTDPATIYAGARAGGLWRTVDGGNHWTPVDSTLPTLHVSAVAIDPADPDRIYVLTSPSVPGEPAGLYRSLSGGSGWTHISDVVAPTVGRLVVAPGDPMRMYCTSPDGIYASFNGGIGPWMLTLPAPAVADAVGRSLAIDPSDTATVYASMRRSGVHKAIDKGGKAGGASWQQLTNGLPTDGADYYDVRVALCSSQPRTLYAGVVTATGTDRFRLFRSDDGGASWNLRSKIIDTGDDASPWRSVAYCGYVGVAHDNPDEVYVGGVNLLRSDDGGTSFAKVTGPHVDHHAFASDRVASGVIYTGCDGGLFRSSDRGKPGTWKQIGRGIDNVEMCDLAAHPTDSAWAFAGTWDNLCIVRTGATTEWVTRCSGGGNGDIVRVVVDPGDPTILYRVSDWGYQVGLWRSTDSGTTWSRIGHDLPGNVRASAAGFSPVLNDCEASARDPGHLIVAASSLRRGGMDASGTWRWSTAFAAPTGTIHHWTSDRHGNEFVGTGGGDVFARRRNGTWDTTPIFSDPGGRRVIDMQVDGFDESNLYVVTWGRGSGSVHLLRRRGSDTMAVDAHVINAAFDENRQVGCLAVDSFRPFTVYAGTDHGVYRGTAKGPAGPWTWVLYNRGMQRVAVNALDVHDRTGVLRAATWGRGAFEVMTDHPIDSMVAAEGHIAWLRAHRRGTDYGAPGDDIDADAVFQLSELPGRTFGVRLRPADPVGGEMLDSLRLAFGRGSRVRVEYRRTNLRNNVIERIIERRG